MKRNGRRKILGLTLIELVVVLMVLVALAGILIPQLSGFVTRSHGATGATNLSETRKFIELYNVKYLAGYGDNYDSLVKTTGGALYDKLNADLAARITSSTLNQTQVDSLNEAGIKQVFDHKDAYVVGDDATNSAIGDSAGAARALAAAGHVAKLSIAAAEAELHEKPADTAIYDYAVFGIGNNSTVVGKAMAEAPLDFEVDPKTEYSRLLVVFRIPKDATTVNRHPLFVGVLGREGEGIAGHLDAYHSAQ